MKLTYFAFIKFNCLLSIGYKFTDRRFLNKLIINSSTHIRSYTWISRRTELSASAQTITFWDCWKVHPKCIMHRSLKSFGRPSQEPMECQWYTMKPSRFPIVRKSKFRFFINTYVDTFIPTVFSKSGGGHNQSWNSQSLIEVPSQVGGWSLFLLWIAPKTENGG